MIKRKNWLTALIFLVCCGLFLLYYGIEVKGADRRPPTLSVPEEPLCVTVSAGDREILAGITAVDDQDGDVTEQIVLESVSHLGADGSAEAVCAAFDRSGNVAKARRKLVYTDYEPPRFTLSAPLIFTEGTRFDVFDLVGAEEAGAGDLSGHVKGMLLSGGSAVEQAGTYEVEFRVTDSMGGTSHLTLPVEVRAERPSGEPLELNAYLVYLKKGDTFDPLTYLTEESRPRGTVVSSDLDVNRPGTYTVDYADHRGEAYGMTRLIAVVEE